MPKLRDKGGKFTTINKGVMDSSFGQQPAQNAVAPLAVKNSLNRVPPIAMWELCSCVRTAVKARNEPFGQVKIRLFTKSGEEVTGGEAFEFFARPNDTQSGSTFLQAVSYWSDICGERAAYFTDGRGKRKAYVLNPMSMAFTSKLLPKWPEEITQWRYIWDNGQLQDMSADDVVRDIDWNPSSLVRGNSPLYAVVNSVDASYKAQRYLRSFFGNNARPSGVLNVDTDNPDLVEPFKTQYLNAMQGEANAWNTFFTAGKKVTYTALDAPVPDGPNNPIQMLIKTVRDEVAALYMVPPLHGGMWDQTKFDSVEEQNNFFYESVWLPRVELIQAYAQKILETQLRFDVPKRRKAMLARSMQNRLEKAIGETDADLVVMLDCEQIPAVANLKKKKCEYAALLQRTFHITPEESAMEVGLDLELNEAAKLVWYESDQTFIEGKPDAKAEDLRAAPQPQEDPNKQEPAGNEAKTNKALESLKGFYRDLRRLTLTRADDGSRWTLKEADELAKQHGCSGDAVYTAVRKAYNALAPMQKAKDKEGIKTYLNGATKTPELRAIAKAMTIESSEPITEPEKKRRKEWLLLLLAFFAWQADKLTADASLQATAPMFVAQLSALLSTEMNRAALAQIAQSPDTSAFIAFHTNNIANEMSPKLNATTERNIQTAMKNGASRIAAIDEAVRKAVQVRATAIEDDMNHVALQVGAAAARKQVVWLTEADERVCTICGPLSGVVVNRGDEFAPGIRWPVVDTHGNCRCKLVEVV